MNTLAYTENIDEKKKISYVGGVGQLQRAVIYYYFRFWLILW